MFNIFRSPRIFFSRDEQRLLYLAQRDISNRVSGDFGRVAACIERARVDFQRRNDTERVDYTFAKFLAPLIADCGAVKWADIFRHYELEGFFGEEGWFFKIWIWADDFGISQRALPRVYSELIKIDSLDFFEYWGNGRKGRVFHEFPDEICRLGNIKYLVLGSACSAEEPLSHMKRLPEMISRMNRIEEIYLQFNALEFIPRSIGDLKRLRILKLGGNNLKALHPDIGRLDELEILSIWNNNISFLPREIGELVSLRGLALWGNPIARLPEEICNLRFLEILEINDMDQLVLSSSQVEWIRNLIANGCMVSIDEGLREIIDDDIPF